MMHLRLVLSAVLAVILGSGAAATAAERRLILYTAGADIPAEPPAILARQAGHGWIIRVNAIPFDPPHEHDLGKALFAQAQAARREGFDRVVLAGRGFGAWISLIANSSWCTPVEGGGIHAVVALDATAGGQTPRLGRQWHDYKFMDVVKTQDPTRLAIMILDTDREEGETREFEIRRTIRRPAIPHLAVYEPAAPALEGEDFARRWGGCIDALISDAALSPPANVWCRPGE